MDLQKMLADNDEVVDKKALIDKQIDNCERIGQINLNQLPAELRQTLQRNILNELNETSKYLDSKIEECSFWIDTCVEREREEQEERKAEEIK